LLNDSKISLVLNSTRYSRRKRRRPIPTMMAAPAVGEPPLNLTTLALPSFNNEDDEGLFSPITCDSSFAFIIPNSHGTQHHVENHITKFHCQRSTAAHHHDSRRSALPPPTSQYASNTWNTGVYAPYEHGAFNRNKKHTDYDCQATPAAHSMPPAHTATLPATNRNSYTQTLPVPSPDPRITSLLALQCQILKDLMGLKPTPASNANTNPSSTPQTTTAMTTMTTRPYSTVQMPPTAHPPPPLHRTTLNKTSQPPNSHLLHW